MVHRFVLLASLTLLALSVRAASPFRQLYDLDDLPLLKAGVRTYQVSSHDPTGGNADYGHFVRVNGNVKVLADLKGPGIVRRIWSANPSGRLKIVVDGAEVVNAPFQDLFQDKVQGFRTPIAGKSSGGSYSYVPIPFRKTCLITATDADYFYYQVTWQTIADPNSITPFTGTVSRTDEPAYNAAVNAWSRLGEERAEARSLVLPRRSISLPPGGRWAQPIRGPGTITSLRLAFAPDTAFSTLRQTILRIAFDGTKPDVEAPIGDFFGMGFEGVRWKSLPMGVDERGAYCYFRMPFVRNARIEIENQSRSSLQATFSGTARGGVPKVPWGYFHANYHTAINVAGRDYVFGKLRGRGHLVGVTESMRGNGTLGFLEGDEKVYVDGGTQPDIYGTGTEDFYNCGWYFRDGPVNVATHGLSHKTDNEIAAWRFEIPDAISFEHAIDFHIEHGGVDDAPGSEYASVIYWYGATGARDLAGPMPVGSALLPRQYIEPIAGAIQAADAAWAGSQGGTVRKQPWNELGAYRGAGRVQLRGKPGAEASFGMDVRFADDYDVDLYLSGAGTGTKATAIVDGIPSGEPVQDSAGPLPVRKVPIGPLHLTEGKHAFGLRILSGSSIALAAVRVNPRSPLVHDFAVLGPFPVRTDGGVNTVLAPDGRTPDLTQGYLVGDKTLKWTVLRASTGMLDLAATLTPNTNVVAYVSFAVLSPSNQTLPLMVGSDDGVAIWVNGKSVWEKHLTRGFKPDEDRVPIPLQAGWNTVLMKVEQGAGAWAVSARLPDTGGTLKSAPFAPAGG